MPSHYFSLENPLKKKSPDSGLFLFVLSINTIYIKAMRPMLHWIKRLAGLVTFRSE